MKLIEKSVKMDETSFAPMMRLTIELPLEIMRDGVALMDVEEVKKVLGTELFDLMRGEKLTHCMNITKCCVSLKTNFLGIGMPTNTFFTA